MSRSRQLVSSSHTQTTATTSTTTAADMEHEIAWKDVQEPLDAKVGTVDGKKGHWCTVYFPPYFRFIAGNDYLDEKERPIPEQVVIIKPLPMDIFIEESSNYPGVFRIQPKPARTAIIKENGKRTHVLLKPQRYEYLPPTTLFHHVPDEFQFATNLPRYRRVEPLECKMSIPMPGPKDGVPGHWYMVYIPSDEIISHHPRPKSNGSVTMTLVHPPVPIFVPDGQHYGGPVDIYTDDECTLERAGKKVVANLARRHFKFWPLVMEGQLPLNSSNEIANLEADQRLQFISYL